MIKLEITAEAQNREQAARLLERMANRVRGGATDEHWAGGEIHSGRLCCEETDVVDTRRPVRRKS